MRYEHSISRLERIGSQFNIVSIEEHGAWVNFCKKGNLSVNRAYFWPNPVSPLNECDICGKLGVPKRVHTRNDVYMWNADSHSLRNGWSRDPFAKSKDMLCTGCWNKVRSVMRKQYEAEHIRQLVYRMKKEISKWRKSQQQAN